ncbi:diacylglycerol kinase [Pseudohalocynthiibacter aestuariivivens]|jgi:diacylglycerol kinase (ATP)|uniref:Diacylglycerol kinase n=1 Tax=Pseudohalocynthiibacter aestuariivivens TaxID=1591409 RepID=A0ABV5JIP0_9RHOB|nr:MULTISPECIES: diacylglycerol kinase [Pseudohalocynthiibacter]MBS9716323.1 diacylglycerol kinase [Pseudohalocynthiibacter aestuariivivens]MCK0100869.1 diacylglycerol kinase [Pseudohalocynthiibacter sp. F2068]
MNEPSSSRRPRPERITGPRHLFAAARFSIAGLRRLWAETAFRHQLLAFCAVIGVLTLLEASMGDYVTAFILFMVLVAVEALNTAIECIVDHISPDWAEFARDAKDLGSLAVLCIMLCYGAFLVSVAYTYLLAVH